MPGSEDTWTTAITRIRSKALAAGEDVALSVEWVRSTGAYEVALTLTVLADDGVNPDDSRSDYAETSAATPRGAARAVEEALSALEGDSPVAVVPDGPLAASILQARKAQGSLTAGLPAARHAAAV